VLAVLLSLRGVEFSSAPGRPADEPAAPAEDPAAPSDDPAEPPKNPVVERRSHD
jgi:hypothetical protein